MVIYLGGRRRKLDMWFKYFMIPHRHSRGPRGGRGGGGVHNDSAGVGLAWKNLPMYFSAQAPTPSGLSLYFLGGGGGGVLVRSAPPCGAPTSAGTSGLVRSGI